ncbi:MAG: DUF58 domain-containing protein [Haloarculaceae archaeon]
MSHRRVYRWRFSASAALALIALGLLYASALLFALTLVPVAYVVYGALSGLPGDASVSVERSFDDLTPYPGEHVTVTLTVTNTGDGTLPDLRLIDGVPDELAVVDGSPRLSAPLRPGDSATLTYTVVARRGEYVFGDPAVRLRSLSGSHQLSETVPAGGDGTLSVFTPLSEAPTRNTTLLRAGTHPTDSGGEGLEFRSTREYQPGDPVNRIHWRRFAKSGELTTVSFREERAVRTVVVVDARDVGRAAPRPGTPTGTELAGYAGQRLYEALVGADVVTSVAAVGLDRDVADVRPSQQGVPWVDGDTEGAFQRAKALFEEIQTGEAAPDTSRALADGTSEAAEPLADGGAGADWVSQHTEALLAQFPPTAEVVFVSPLLDDWPVQLARTLHERGYPLTLVSPDVTGGDSLAQQVLAMERSHRLHQAAAAGATTIPWDPADSIEVTLSESLEHLLSA